VVSDASTGPRPWWFLGAVVGWTWAFLWPATATGQPWLAFPTVLLTFAGLLGPLLMTIAFVAAGWWHEPPGVFWRRTLDPRSVDQRWLWAAIGLAVLLASAPAWVVALGGGSAPWAAVAGSAPAVFLIVGLLAGIVEEPAWRGYAQVALQRRVPVALAALAVGAFWAAWHLPLFYLEGTYQASLGVGTRAFWTFHLALLAGSVVYAWLVGSAGGAAVVGVVYHAFGNALRELLSVPGTEAIELTTEVLLAAALLALGWRWMRRPLQARRARPAP
jgi:uncharacterized protein